MISWRGISQFKNALLSLSFYWFFTSTVATFLFLGGEAGESGTLPVGGWRAIFARPCDSCLLTPISAHIFHPNYVALLLCSLGWTLVFKAVSGQAMTPYDAYKSDETYAESEMDALDVTNTYPNEYKNRIVLRWEEFNPSEVRLRSIEEMHD